MIIYSKKALSIKYDDKEIRGILNDYVEKHKSDVFSYHQFCNYLFDYADAHNQLGKESNTTYLSAEMMPEDYSRVSKILWEKIWDREICIDFYHNPYSQNFIDDTRFVIINR